MIKNKNNNNKVCVLSGTNRKAVKVMQYATLKNFDEIYSVFKENRKIFPHIRTDYLKRQIKRNNVIFDSGVILIKGVYKKTVHLGNQTYQKGTNIIHQIVNSEKGNGNATKVLKNFLNTLNDKVVLTVRKSNEVARNFYEKNDFKQTGLINWSNNKIKGVIYDFKK